MLRVAKYEDICVTNKEYMYNVNIKEVLRVCPLSQIGDKSLNARNYLSDKMVKVAMLPQNNFSFNLSNFWKTIKGKIYVYMK